MLIFSHKGFISSYLCMLKNKDALKMEYFHFRRITDFCCWGVVRQAMWGVFCVRF
ncbi:hypothetical protein BC832DRAFT_552721 [Gaertneriomyces semiglobifer]|nr:hypothetical protein BC832DRAFT_552721 [Gaertneriomyces semiglobifer]